MLNLTIQVSQHGDPVFGDLLENISTARLTTDARIALESTLTHVTVNGYVAGAIHQ